MKTIGTEIRKNGKIDMRKVGYNLGTQVISRIEDVSTCLVDPTSTHFDHNDHFFVSNDEPVALYAIWWGDRGVRKRSVRDADMVIGTSDNFTPGDFAALGAQGTSTGNGRDIHGRCRDPRPTGRVDIVIEQPEFEGGDGSGGGPPPF